MGERIAVIYYGQARIISGYDFALSSLLEYCKGYELDIFIHLWFISPQKQQEPWIRLESIEDLKQFITGVYKPKKYKIEESRFFVDSEWLHPDTLQQGRDVDLNRMISQLYSIQEACRLVEDPEQYNKFMLVRTDSIFDFWTFPSLVSLDSSRMNISQDWINIFGRTHLERYAGLLDYLKKTPITDRISPKTLRYHGIEKVNDLGLVGSITRRNRNTALLIGLKESTLDYENYISTENVMYRRVKDLHICRFAPKTSHRQFQWFGIHIPSKSQCKITYKIRFLKGSCPARWKTHSPEKTSSDWFTKTGEWHNIASEPVSYLNSPFIFIFLDDILNSEEIIVEITDITSF